MNAPANAYRIRSRGTMSLSEWAGGVIRLDARDPVRYVKQIDALRNGLFVSINRVWRENLKSESRALIDTAQAAQTLVGFRETILANVDEFFGAQEPYNITYANVAPVVGERVYDGLLGIKAAAPAIFTKADPEQLDEWLRAALEYIAPGGEGYTLVTAVEGVSHSLVRYYVTQLTEEALRNGWSINTLSEKFEQRMTSIADYRARRIARTEVMRSGNFGSHTAALATGLALEKEWLTGPYGTGDRHATEDYPGLNGQKRKMDELYQVGAYTARYPLDMSLPAKESIQCRCSEGYIPV